LFVVVVVVKIRKRGGLRPPRSPFRGVFGDGVFPPPSPSLPLPPPPKKKGEKEGGRRGEKRVGGETC